MNKIDYNPDILTCLASLSNDEVFTPPKIVNDMLDLLPATLWSDKNAKFLDPVSKTGIFLREIAKRLDKGLEKQIPDKQKRVNHILTNQLYGIAITELTALVSRRSLYCSKTANGKYSVCIEFKNKDGNIRFVNIKHDWDNGRCKYCGASQEVYDRGDELESHAYELIHTRNPEEVFKMKFDVIVGNPPYQLNVGVEKENYAIPLYQLFIEQAMKLNPHFISMIIPARWFTGGRGLDEFRKKMLSDKRLKIIVDYPDSRDCFPGVDVSGGVMYFLWDKQYKGQCKFTSILGGASNTAMRDLNEFDIFPRYNTALFIIRKILKMKEKMMNESVSSQTPFGLYTNFTGTKNGTIRVLTSRGFVHANKSEITRGGELINKYKVSFSKATTEHAGQTNSSGMRQVLSTIKVLEPNTVCTQSYLLAGVFGNKNQAENLAVYLRTRFVRFLLFQATTSQDLSRDKFMFVPIQDFSKPWTDAELYKKYNLTRDEIDFVESMIRPIISEAQEEDVPDENEE